MKPGLCKNWWNVGLGVEIGSVGKVGGFTKGCELLGVKLLNHTESPKLTLIAVVESIMICISRHKSIFTDVIKSFLALNHLHWEGKAGLPWPSGVLVT